MEASKLNKIEQELLQLIQDYISCSIYLCNLLKEKIKSGSSILRAKVIKDIPKEGKLDNCVYYKLHGVGCFFRFDASDLTLDVDFGPNDRCDGFDLYRLRDFYENSKTRYKELEKEGNIEFAFSSLVNKGVIYNPKWKPSEHLFYIKHHLDSV